MDNWIIKIKRFFLYKNFCVYTYTYIYNCINFIIILFNNIIYLQYIYIYIYIQIYIYIHIYIYICCKYKIIPYLNKCNNNNNNNNNNLIKCNKQSLNFCFEKREKV